MDGVARGMDGLMDAGNSGGEKRLGRGKVVDVDGRASKIVTGETGDKDKARFDVYDLNRELGTRDRKTGSRNVRWETRLLARCDCGTTNLVYTKTRN
jgi:hypothetical protein